MLAASDWLAHNRVVEDHRAHANEHFNASLELCLLAQKSVELPVELAHALVVPILSAMKKKIPFPVLHRRTTGSCPSARAGIAVEFPGRIRSG